MKHHPDRGGDPEKFKSITHAYETLSDPQKKEMYELESKLTTWQKKVEILEMAAKRSRSQLRAMCFEGR